MAKDRVYDKVACKKFNPKSKHLLIPNRIDRNWLIRQVINPLNFFRINLLVLRAKKTKKGSQNSKKIGFKLKTGQNKKWKDLEDFGLSAYRHLGQIPQIFFLLQFGLNWLWFPCFCFKKPIFSKSHIAQRLIPSSPTPIMNTPPPFLNSSKTYCVPQKL